MSRTRPPAEDTAASLAALATFAEVQLHAGQGLDVDDWHRLLDAGADEETLHALNRLDDRPSLGSLGRLTTHLHRINDPGTGC